MFRGFSCKLQQNARAGGLKHERKLACTDGLAMLVHCRQVMALAVPSADIVSCHQGLQVTVSFFLASLSCMPLLPS